MIVTGASLARSSDPNGMGSTSDICQNFDRRKRLIQGAPHS